MCLTEFDVESAIKTWQEDGYEDGYNEGRQEKRKGTYCLTASAFFVDYQAGCIKGKHDTAKASLTHLGGFN